MKTLCVIPARYASSRLPGKPLALIGDKPMIRWVYEQAIAADQIDQVVVATDDVRIKEAVEAFGGTVEMTPAELASGTDRVALVASNYQADVVLNLQGDEPFVSSDLLSRMTQVFINPEIEMATPIKQIHSVEELEDPNLVRVVTDKKHYALYFSRAVIPFVRDIKVAEEQIRRHKFYKHLGIYAYRKTLLSRLAQLPPSRLEQMEKLEQLRALENGIRIFTVETEYDSVGVDTAQDLERVNKILTQNHYKSDKK